MSKSLCLVVVEYRTSVKFPQPDETFSKTVRFYFVTREKVLVFKRFWKTLSPSHSQVTELQTTADLVSNLSEFNKIKKRYF